MQPEVARPFFMLPSADSTLSADVDGLFLFVTYLSIFFFTIIVAGMAWFVFQYRDRPGRPKVKQVSHSTVLEVTWSVIPTILVIFIFIWGVKGFMDMAVAPRGAVEVQVTGKKWQWEFDSPDFGKSLNELVVEVDKPVKLILSAEDVLHSFYVPDFRVKMDAVPGRYTTLWFQATKVGEHQVFCTEYCGTGHSAMLAKVVVLSAEDYAKRKAESQSTGEISAASGEKLYSSKNCKACHSIDGARVVGPSFKALWDKDESLADGSTVKVDENYLRESILDPNAKIVATYPPAMPPYKGLLKDHEIGSLIAYIKSLQ